jgi:choline dehydrogenase
LASRLTEDAGTTVLVLEAGDTGDAVSEKINVPTEAYFNGLLGSSYDWQYQSVPQVNLANRNVSWPRGKLLGGSTAVNGMYLVRPSALEMDTWSQLQGNVSGATAWEWDSMFKAMTKVRLYARLRHHH